MTVKIENAKSGDREQLRNLLLDAADQLIGDGYTILESKLRWEGQPILLADADLHPVLVSFEPEYSEAALLNGLRGVEQLDSALIWINQVYETLQQQQRPPKLVVVAREFPPGAVAVLRACPDLSVYRYRLLDINGETALWLERLNPVADMVPVQDSPSRQDTATALPQQASNDILPPLSEAESAYFQQL
jgi:hypothetical protein